MLLNCNKSLRSRWARSQVCGERFRDALGADVLSVVQHPCQLLAHLTESMHAEGSGHQLSIFSPFLNKIGPLILTLSLLSLFLEEKFAEKLAKSFNANLDCLISRPNLSHNCILPEQKRFVLTQESYVMLCVLCFAGGYLGDHQFSLMA